MSKREEPYFSGNIAGPLMLYTYAGDSPKREGVLFRAVPENGQWDVDRAKGKVEEILQLGYSLRIENEAGGIVFLAHNGKIQWPLDADAAAFWRECGK